MSKVMNSRAVCIFGGLCGVCGVLLLATSFAINSGPPSGANLAELANFAQHNYAKVMWGAWMQAVGPVLIVLFAFALVHLAGATQQLAGWMTFFGATILMTVSLIEITFYIGALYRDPAIMPLVSLNLISAVQHLYFMVAAPALFLPLGVVLIRSRILPRLFGYSAFVLATLFGVLGIVILLRLTPPDSVTAFAGVQALWWLAAAIALFARRQKISGVPGIYRVRLRTDRTTLAQPFSGRPIYRAERRKWKFRRSQFGLKVRTNAGGAYVPQYGMYATFQ